MAFDAFLKLVDIPGESVDKAHPGEIQIESFSWGSQNTVSFSFDKLTSGKVSFSPLNIVKVLDKTSPVLMLRCCNGQVIKSAVLTLRKAGESPQEFFKITLGNVVVTGVSQSGAAGSDRPMESVELSFLQITQEYPIFDSLGRITTVVKTGWDIGLGKAL